MPALTGVRMLAGLLRARLSTSHTEPERGGIMSEYAVLIGIAAAAITIVAGVIIAITARFNAFTGGGG